MATIAPPDPRHADYAALVARLDPRGALRNEWLQRVAVGNLRGPA